MKYQPQSFKPHDAGECEITSVLLTPALLLVEWREHGQAGRLEATSLDGLHYKGHSGYPTPSADRHVEFRRYQAPGRDDVVLAGRWWKVGGQGGPWAIQLDAAAPLVAPGARSAGNEPQPS